MIWKFVGVYVVGDGAATAALRNTFERLKRILDFAANVKEN